jgi:hypothetical protein
LALQEKSSDPRPSFEINKLNWEKYPEILHYIDLYLKYYAYVTMKGDRKPRGG